MNLTIAPNLKFSENYVVKRTFKGLKTYFINDSVRKSVNELLSKVLKSRELQKNIFGHYLSSEEVKNFRLLLRKHDQNNYWLSFVLFLHDQKHFKFEDFSSRPAIFAALKLLAVYPYAEQTFRGISFAATLTQLINHFLETSGLNLNVRQKLTAKAALHYQWTFIAEMVHLILVRGRAKISTELLVQMAEFNFYEHQKSQYFLKNSSNTIFGAIGQKEIARYSNQKSMIERKLIASEVNIPNAEKYESAITNIDTQLSKYQKLANYLTTEFARLGWAFGEYQFILEQTARPYLRDKIRLTGRDYVMLSANYLILLFWAAIIALPVEQIIQHAFNAMSFNNLDTRSFVFSTASFEFLFNNTQFLTWLKNSLIAAVVVTSVVLVASSLLAYALSRFRFRGRRPAFLFLTLIGMFPATLGVTTFIVLNRMIRDNFDVSPYFVLAIFWTGGSLLGFATSIKSYMDTISREIDEAAKIDGASNFGIFYRLILPLIAPILGVIALQTFIIPFVDFYLPSLLLTSSSDYNMSRGLAVLASTTSGSALDIYRGPFVAGSLITAIPITLVYFSADFFMKKDKMQGAIKG